MAPKSLKSCPKCGANMIRAFGQKLRCIRAPTCDGLIDLDLSDVVCLTCGETGHFARHCPATRPLSLSCWVCGSDDHLQRDCPDATEDVSEVNRYSCWVCGSDDHLQEDCPNVTEDVSALVCKCCGNTGHFIRDCPNFFMFGEMRSAHKLVKSLLAQDAPERPRLEIVTRVIREIDRLDDMSWHFSQSTPASFSEFMDNKKKASKSSSASYTEFVNQSGASADAASPPSGSSAPAAAEAQQVPIPAHATVPAHAAVAAAHGNSTGSVFGLAAVAAAVNARITADGITAAADDSDDSENPPPLQPPSPPMPTRIGANIEAIHVIGGATKLQALQSLSSVDSSATTQTSPRAATAPHFENPDGLAVWMDKHGYWRDDEGKMRRAPTSLHDTSAAPSRKLRDTSGNSTGSGASGASWNFLS